VIPGFSDIGFRALDPGAARIWKAYVGYGSIVKCPLMFEP
jgi:hypothetical protein